MDFEWIYIGYIALGFVVGVMTGLTGMGAAVLLTPILILIGIKPLEAVGTNLIFMAGTKLFGVFFHKQKGNVNFKLGLNLIIGAIPAIIIGYFVLLFVDKEIMSKYITLVLAILLVILAFLSFIQLVKKRDEEEGKFNTGDLKGVLILGGVGSIVGLCMMFTSVGAGVLVVFSLTFVLKLDAKMVVGTSILIGLVLSVMSGISHIVLGNVDFLLAGFLMVGSIFGIFIGTQLITKIPVDKLKTGFSFVILGLGIITFIAAIVKW